MIAPPKNNVFFSRAFSWLLDTRKDAMKKVSACNFLFAEDDRTVTSGWFRGIVFQEVRPGASFKTGDFAEEKLGWLLYNHSI